MKRVELILVLSLVVVILVLPKAQAATLDEMLQRPEIIKPLLRQGKLYPVDVPNPHWKQGFCVACHEGAQFKRQTLRSRNISELCGYCHNEYSKASFEHPTGPSINDHMWEGIPADFQQSLGTLGRTASRIMNCLTCHDLKIQCIESRSYEKFSNPLFLRNGPFNNRIELCFYCHEDSMFHRLNPHKQIVQGELDKDSCKICHLNTENLDTRTEPKDVRLLTDSDLSKLCFNCHPSKPHPGGELKFTKKKAANHLVVPKDKTRLIMERMRQETKIEFPLDPQSGEIHCATCHNPHEKGVVAFKAADTGSDIKHRLRIKKPCRFCHDN